MDEFWNAVVGGAGHGAFDALLALGIVLTYRTSGVLNFAQASTGTFAAFVMVSVAQGRPLLLALGAGMLAGAAAGAGTYGVVREIRATSNPLTAAVATLAVALVLQQFVRVGWGSDPTNLVFPQPFGFDTFSVGSVVIAHIYVAALATACAVALGIGALLRWTRTGTMVRAMADDLGAARLCGANALLLTGGVWAVSGVLAAVAGFFAAQLLFGPGLLDLYFVGSLVAAVLAGLRSLTLAFVAALLLEITSSLIQTYASSWSAYPVTIEVVLLIAVMVLTPARWLRAGERRV